jgi:class 3 adenylate cyclase
MKRDNKLLFVVFLLMTVFVISFANAEILISQPKAFYNLGDEISFDIKIDSIKTGYFDADLICNGLNKNIYHNVPESTSFGIKRKLISDYIGDLTGVCYVKLTYGADEKASQNFEISNEIDISLEIENMTYSAGDNIKIKGTAIKKNNELLGQDYAAFAEVFLNYGNETISASNIIKDGRFNVNFSTQEIMRSGNYALTVKVYDKDSQGNVLNFETTNAQIRIIQRPAKIDIALDKTLINPGEEIKVIPFLYDKAGDLIESKLLIKITDSEENVLYRGFVDANKELVLMTETNTFFGYAKIIAQKDSVVSEKAFEISQLKEIKAEISNHTLFITNVGNIPYNGVIEISIGNNKILKEISLDLNGNISLDVSAPDGIYDIIVRDDKNTYSQQGVSLTGSAISVREAGQKIGNFITNYPIVWVFIILIFIFLGYALYRKNKEKMFSFDHITKFSGKKPADIKKSGGIEIINKDKIVDKIKMGEIREAEQTGVLQGHKQQAGIISIKIKNSNEMTSVAKENLTKALEYAYQKKAVSYSIGDYILLIFTPLITKSNKNEEATVRAAMDIDNFLRDFNRKFKTISISYGIGANSGEIINRIEGNALKFASIDKTINLAKRIADAASNDLLLSREIHEKTMNNIKADKTIAGGMELFKIKRVVDTDASKRFIDEFMRRN